MKIKKPTISKKRAHKIKCGISSVASAILGSQHFVLKSAADIVVHAEAGISRKLTGTAKHEVIEDRHNTTSNEQDRLINAAKEARKAILQLMESDVSTDSQIL